jgi:carbonic anhydrase/acetyltransferase-like protein (isoleucine patch superfamily)
MYTSYTVYQIRCLTAFDDVEAGDLGGWVSNSDNLSQYGNCWAYDDAVIFEDGLVQDDAKMYDNSEVWGGGKLLWYAKLSGTAYIEDAEVSDHAEMSGASSAYENAKVYEYAKLSGNGQIYGDSIAYGHCEMRENSQVYDYSEISGNCKMSGNAQIESHGYGFGNAELKDDVMVYYWGKAYGNAKLSNNAQLYYYAEARDNAVLKDDSMAYYGAEIYEGAVLSGLATVDMGAKIHGNVSLGTCYVSGLVDMYGVVSVSGDAPTPGSYPEIHDRSIVYGFVTIQNSAYLQDDCQVYGFAEITGTSIISKNAIVRECSIVHDTNVGQDEIVETPCVSPSPPPPPLSTMLTNLLIEQFRKDKPKLHGLLNSIGGLIDDLLLILDDLKLYRGIRLAEGANLDLIGAIVGCARTSATDSIYREDIYFQIAINNSKGVAEELISALKQISGAATVDLSENFPATITLTINGSVDIPSASTIARLNKIRSAGVSLILQYTPGATHFVFGGEGSFPAYFPDGEGFGETGAGWETVGGNIVELIS